MLPVSSEVWILESANTSYNF